MRKLKYAWLWLRSFFPTELPKGLTAFNKWTDDIITLAGPAIPNNRSTRFAISTMALHDRGGKSAIPMRHYVQKLRRAATNEVAFQLLSQMKEEQDKATKERQEKLVGTSSDNGGSPVGKVLQVGTVPSASA